MPTSVLKKEQFNPPINVEPRARLGGGGFTHGKLTQRIDIAASTCRHLGRPRKPGYRSSTILVPSTVTRSKDVIYVPPVT